MPDPLPAARPLRHQLDRLRRKMVALLGGTVPPDVPGGGPSEGLPLDAALAMLYPSREPSDLHAVAYGLVGDSVVDLHGLRQLLTTFDRQFFPSPMSIRFGPSDIVTHALDNGMTIFLDREDGAVSRPLLNGDYEAHLVPTFRQFCRPGMTVVDVGANVGLYTLLASSLVGPSGRVVAVEPSSENCRLILLSVEANNVGNVELFPVALDAARGWSNLTGHFGSNGGLVSADPSSLKSGWSEIVPTFALDDLVEGKVDFVKIDVEGAEGRVVAGARGDPHRVTTGRGHRIQSRDAAPRVGNQRRGVPRRVRGPGLPGFALQPRDRPARPPGHGLRAVAELGRPLTDRGSAPPPLGLRRLSNVSPRPRARGGRSGACGCPSSCRTG